VKTRTDRGHTS